MRCFSWPTPDGVDFRIFIHPGARKLRPPSPQVFQVYFHIEKQTVALHRDETHTVTKGKEIEQYYFKMISTLSPKT